MAGWQHLEEVDHSSGTRRGRKRGSADRGAETQKNQGGGGDRVTEGSTQQEQERMQGRPGRRRS